MTGLRLGTGVTLPIEAVTETFGFLAKRGKGKTYAASVLAEEMIDAGLPVLIIDPLGVWWGLRSSASGKAKGLPVVIFGGEHADVPLAEGSATLIADVVVDERVPAILDLSDLSKAARQRFIAPFLERVYQRNRDPLHIFVDEADMFAPQRLSPDAARTLGAMEDLQRRGRARGIGTSLISQRPAVLNKNVLTQVEILIVLGMTGPQDVKAIDEWTSQHADPDEAVKVKRSLSGLDVGEAWVWSPTFLDLLVRTKIRKRRTFDSSATPKPGETRVTPREFSAVDVAAIAKRVEVIEEKRKATDPKVLQQRILDLQAEVYELRSAPQPEPERVSVVTDADWDRFTLLVGDMSGASRTYREATEALKPLIQKFLDVSARPAKVATPRAEKPRAAQSTGARPITAPDSSPLPTRGSGAGHRSDGENLPKMQRAILSVLAHGPRQQSVAAVMAGYRISGSWKSNLARLRVLGYVEGSGTLSITDAGRAALGPVDPLPTGPELREWWKAHQAVNKASGAMLDALAEVWPDGLSAAEIAEATGYEISGAFKSSLARIRALGLAHGKNGVPVRIDDALMEA